MLENKVLFREVLSGFAMRRMLLTEFHLLILDKQKTVLHAHEHRDLETGTTAKV